LLDSPNLNLTSPKEMSGERITTTMKMRKANLSVIKKVNGKDHREKVLPKNPTKDGTNLKVTLTKKGRKKPPPSPYFFCDGPHWSPDCPKKNKLMTLLAIEEEEPK